MAPVLLRGFLSLTIFHSKFKYMAPNLNIKINTAIIDDEEEFLFSLKEHLTFYPEIEIIGCASKTKQARCLLQDDRLDLVFLDIEMPVKNGFELLQEARKSGKVNFSVVFYTAYDKYVIQALRESAFDYILKPVRPEELKNAVERYKLEKKSLQKPVAPFVKKGLTDIIALPCPTGIRFIDKDNILLFQCGSGGLLEKRCWSALLTDRALVKLRSGTAAKDIMEFVGDTKFVRVNQAFIVNVNYLAAIEYKSRECQLLPPFNDLIIIASRSNISEIRERFDIL